MQFLRQYLDIYAATINHFAPGERVNTVGASDVGQCIRKVYWTKAEGTEFAIEQDIDYVDTYGAKLRGTMFEDNFWAPALKASFGDRLLYSGRDQRTFVSGFLSATPDGLLVGLTEEERLRMVTRLGCSMPGDAVMVECKTVDPRTNLAEAKVENVFQTHVQMGLVRELTQYKPTHSILSYTDASWWNDGREFAIEFDPEIYENAKNRAMRIQTGSFEEMEPEGWLGGGTDCEYCPYARSCGVERKRVPDEVAIKNIDPQFVAEMTDLAREYRMLDASIDEQTDAKKLIEHQIKTRLRDKQLRKVPGVVSWSSTKGRRSYDNKAIQEAAIEAGIDIEDFAREGDPSDRFQVTLREKSTA